MFTAINIFPLARQIVFIEKVVLEIKIALSIVIIKLERFLELCHFEIVIEVNSDSKTHVSLHYDSQSRIEIYETINGIKIILIVFAYLKSI